MEPKRNLVVFLESGRTFTFKNIEVVADNETVLQFRYVAMSDGKLKLGTFSKFRIVGWSIYDA